MDDCVFCKIIREASAMELYRDERTVAFMDVAGDVDGHILVIPKKHVTGILDCDAFTLNRIMDTVQKISRHLVEHCGYEGVNLLNASGECAGQSVPHFHIHLIPRKKQDGIDAWPAFPGKTQEIETVYQRLRLSDL